MQGLAGRQEGRRADRQAGRQAGGSSGRQKAETGSPKRSFRTTNDLHTRRQKKKERTKEEEEVYSKVSIQHPVLLNDLV